MISNFENNSYEKLNTSAIKLFSQALKQYSDRTEKQEYHWIPNTVLNQNKAPAPIPPQKTP